jgi:hypothetical protein
MSAFQPHLDQMQHAPINNPARLALPAVKPTMMRTDLAG